MKAEWEEIKAICRTILGQSCINDMTDAEYSVLEGIATNAESINFADRTELAEHLRREFHARGLMPEIEASARPERPRPETYEERLARQKEEEKELAVQDYMLEIEARRRGTRRPPLHLSRPRPVDSVATRPARTFELPRLPVIKVSKKLTKIVVGAVVVVAFTAGSVFVWNNIVERAAERTSVENNGNMPSQSFESMVNSEAGNMIASIRASAFFTEGLTEEQNRAIEAIEEVAGEIVQMFAEEDGLTSENVVNMIVSRVTDGGINLRQILGLQQAEAQTGPENTIN